MIDILVPFDRCQHRKIERDRDIFRNVTILTCSGCGAFVEISVRDMSSTILSLVLLSRPDVPFALALAGDLPVSRLELPPMGEQPDPSARALVSAAAEASELFTDDELEAAAEQRKRKP